MSINHKCVERICKRFNRYEYTVEMPRWFVNLNWLISKRLTTTTEQIVAPFSLSLTNVLPSRSVACFVVKNFRLCVAHLSVVLVRKLN